MAVLRAQRHGIANALRCVHRLIKEEVHLVVLVDGEILVPLLVLSWPVGIARHATCATMIFLERGFIEGHARLKGQGCVLADAQLVADRHLQLADGFIHV